MILVLINEQAGTVIDRGEAAVRAEIEAALEGREARYVTGAVPALLREIGQGEDTVVTIGGDGTVGAVAKVLAGRKEAPRFVPLPYGTMNLIHRDIGSPLDPMEALRAGLAAPVRAIDYAEANGEALLHSAVFGTFAEVAEEREEMRAADGPLQMLRAALGAATRLLDAEPHPYALTIDGEAMSVTTNAIFVTNNAITGGERGVPIRERLDAGELVVYVSDSLGAGGFVQRLIEAVTGGFDESHGILRYVAREAHVRAEDGPATYARDGEVVEDQREVTLTIQPGTLRVPDLRRDALRVPDLRRGDAPSEA